LAGNHPSDPLALLALGAISEAVDYASSPARIGASPVAELWR